MSSKIIENSKITVFGDSHSNFYKHIPFCSAIYLGGQLAYTLAKRKETILETFKERANARYALYCFGEIDIRFHLPKYNNLEECANNYINSVLDFNLPSIISGVVATTWLQDGHSTPPVLSNEIDRNIMTREFNSILKYKCEQNNIKFFNIFESLVDSDMRTIRRYYCTDSVHLDKPAVELVQPLLENILL